MTCPEHSSPGRRPYGRSPLNQTLWAEVVLRAALAVECPDCFAEAGEPCYSNDGTEYVPVHHGRADGLCEHVARAEELLRRPERGLSVTRPEKIEEKGVIVLGGLWLWDALQDRRQAPR